MNFRDNLEILRRCYSSPLPSTWELIFAGIAWSCFARERGGYGVALAAIAALHWITRRLLAIKATQEIRFLRDYMERAARNPVTAARNYEYMAEASTDSVAKMGIMKTLVWWAGIAMIAASLLIQ